MKKRTLIFSLLISSSASACDTTSAPATSTRISSPPTYTQIATPHTYQQMVATPATTKQSAYYVDQSGRVRTFHSAGTSVAPTVVYAQAPRPVAAHQATPHLQYARATPANTMNAALVRAVNTSAITPAPAAEQVYLHQVSHGETVYSMARRSCNSVENIKAMNSLDGTFKIHVGEVILLPGSRC